MKDIEKILECTSIGDASLKLYGYSNGYTKNKILEILGKNGLNTNLIFPKNPPKNKKYEKIIKECPVCKNTFNTIIGHKREKSTCSISCSNSFKPKRIKNEFSNSIKQKKRIKKKYNKECILCNKYYEGTKKSKYCSEECRKYSLKIQMDERIKRGDHKGWQSRNIESYPEKFFKKVLDNLRIKYLFNHPVKKIDLGINESSCYFLDFYIEIFNRRIDLEIDGKQHEYKERKDKDLIRDSLLKNNGYEVYRIKWKNPINIKNKEYIKNEIERMIKYLGI